MSLIHIKNLLQFKQTLRAGMILNRIWFHEDSEQKPLERRILEVQTNGFWVENTDPEAGDSADERLWVAFMHSCDWVFMNGYVYMIFNHDADQKAKEKDLRSSDYLKYLDRLATYKQQLDNGEFYSIKGYKVLAKYSIISE